MTDLNMVAEKIREADLVLVGLGEALGSWAASEAEEASRGLQDVGARSTGQAAASRRAKQRMRQH